MVFIGMGEFESYSQPINRLLIIYQLLTAYSLRAISGFYKGSSRIHVESNAEVHHFRTFDFLTGYQVQDTARWESKI